MNLSNLIPELVFYLFAGVALLCATTVAFGRKPVVNVVALVGAFIAGAVLWLLANAEFLGLALIFVYVGAVMTLFLFVVMMLNLEALPEKAGKRHLFAGGLIFIVLVSILVWLTHDVVASFDKGHNLFDHAQNNLSTEAIGHVLYTNWWPVFQLVAVILLVAMVASIAIVHRTQKHRRVQNIKAQVSVTKSERLTLIEDEKL